MAHGYLGDGYGSHGEINPDREDDHRERHWRERSWRGRDDDRRSRDHDRESGIFGSSDRDEWRGGRRDWSSDDGGDRSARGGFRGGFGSERQQGNFGGSSRFSRDDRGYSAHPDDHYRSWRDRHMSEIDRDYQDYCREREQQFHREFDDWRQQKYGNPQPLRTGMTQSGISHDPSGETQAIEEGTGSQPVASDPTAAATLGTNSGSGGRSRR